MTSTVPFSQRIEQLRTLLAEADAVLVGAGSGLSTAAGLDYAGSDFRREFAPWIERYGITDLYTSSFYPFPTEEELWAYWARHIWFSRFRTGGTDLYKTLNSKLRTHNCFVITTNTDAQFELSGFDPDCIFATQGDYAYLQGRSGDNKELYYCEAWVREAMAATVDCRIPSGLIPRHPRTGEPLAPNLRCDDTFVEDARWHRQSDRYRHFLRDHHQQRLLLLEFGIGFNTPGIIRFPFEQMALQFPSTTLVRFNRDHPASTLDSLIDDGNPALHSPLSALRSPLKFLPFTEPIADILAAL